MGGKMLNKTLVAAAVAAIGTAANAGLVAYFPLNDGAAGSTANTIDDIIDDASHGVADGTANNGNALWVNDATRGIVLSTEQSNHFVAGTQDIDLNVGFTWSLWVKSDSVANADAGADVIIGSRNGTWNKVQPNGTSRFFDLGFNVDDDTWHHLAYTGDLATGGAFYVDGVEVATDATSFNGLTTVNDVMEIGGSSRFSERWTGLMDDIAIWDERLSAATILGIANGDPIQGPSGPPGDTDGDGDIDDSDLGTSFSNYTGPVGALGGKTAAQGDTDGDGDVDDSDLGTSFSGYTGPLAAAVPEPTSLALLGLGGLLIARRRRD